MTNDTTTTTTGRREVTSVGWDGRSNPMFRYVDEMHLPDHMRSIVRPTDRPDGYLGKVGEPKPVGRVWVARMSRRYPHGLHFEVSYEEGEPRSDGLTDIKLAARFADPIDAEDYARRLATKLTIGGPERRYGWVRLCLLEGVVVRINPPEAS